MPKYFLRGTKYEAFERIMMETPRHYPAETEGQSKSVPPAKNTAQSAKAKERSQ